MPSMFINVSRLYQHHTPQTRRRRTPRLTRAQSTSSLEGFLIGRRVQPVVRLFRHVENVFLLLVLALAMELTCHHNAVAFLSPFCISSRNRSRIPLRSLCVSPALLQLSDLSTSYTSINSSGVQIVGVCTPRPSLISRTILRTRPLAICV